MWMRGLWRKIRRQDTSGSEYCDAGERFTCSRHGRVVQAEAPFQGAPLGGGIAFVFEGSLHEGRGGESALEVEAKFILISDGMM